MYTAGEGNTGLLFFSYSLFVSGTNGVRQKSKLPNFIWLLIRHALLAVLQTALVCVFGLLSEMNGRRFLRERDCFLLPGRHEMQRG